MSQAIPTHPDGNLRAVLIDHRETFEILAEHDDNNVAELFGEYPLELIEELPDREDNDVE